MWRPAEDSLECDVITWVVGLSWQGSDTSVKGAAQWSTYGITLLSACQLAGGPAGQHSIKMLKVCAVTGRLGRADPVCSQLRARQQGTLGCFLLPPPALFLALWSLAPLPITPLPMVTWPFVPIIHPDQV
jgi:hypothetical protein